MTRRVWLGGAAVFGLAGAVVAQQANDPKWVRTERVAPVSPAGAAGPPLELPEVQPPAGPVVPDPTKPSDKLNKALNPAPKGAVPGPAALLPKIPPMALKARVLAAGKPGAVVIEADGHQYTVGPGVTFVAGGMPMRVLEVTRTEVRIEVLPLNEIIVLN